MSTFGKDCTHSFLTVLYLNCFNNSHKLYSTWQETMCYSCDFPFEIKGRYTCSRWITDRGVMIHYNDCNDNSLTVSTVASGQVSISEIELLYT